jgi:hypothetical protein
MTNPALSRAVNNAIANGAPVYVNEPSPRAARDNILEALATFAAKRPGLNPRDYITDWRDVNGRKAYASDARGITRDLHHARALLTAVRLSGITEEQLIEAFRSKRLSWDGQSLDYCVNSYFPTEYRKAVCAVLASALWNYYREDCCCDTGDKIRAAAHRALPRAIALRWFN